MRRREVLKAMAAGLGVGATSRLLAETPQTNPNIILCMADDQGWGDMAYYGHPSLHTPNFDRMAAAGLRFDRFYASAPVCSPTRGSVLTGRNPNRFGCFKWGHSIRPQEITLAEVCRKAGYATGHFGKWHLGSVLEGSPVNPGANGFEEWFSAPNFFDNDPILSREGKAVPVKGESSMITVDAAIEFIRKHTLRDSKPFLAVIWFGSPHNPHSATMEDRNHYRDRPEELQHFYGEITGMDRAFGKLRNEIDNLGIREETILWYCSDNGGLPNLSSTGGREFKGSIYEGGLRVPAILEWPRLIRSPGKVSLPCSTSDIYPTILDILNLEVPGQPPIDGTSLLPVINGERPTNRKPIGFWDRPEGGIRVPSHEWMEELWRAQQQGIKYDNPERLRLDAGKIETKYPDKDFSGHSAWLDWPWKVHRIEDDSDRLKLELYNLEDDPMEQNDLASSMILKTDQMKTALEAWLTSVVKSLNGLDY